MAANLPISSTEYLFSNHDPIISLTDSIITGCITQSPNNVITKNNTICFLVFLPSCLNVNFLFAKKLKVSAVDVDIKLLTNAGIPKATKINKIAKSIDVLNTPTTPKRIFSACFFRSFCNVTVLYKIKWAIFDFFENTTNVFTYYSNRQQLYAAQE